MCRTKWKFGGGRRVPLQQGDFRSVTHLFHPHPSIHFGPLNFPSFLPPFPFFGLFIGSRKLISHHPSPSLHRSPFSAKKIVRSTTFFRLGKQTRGTRMVGGGVRGGICMLCNLITITITTSPAAVAHQRGKHISVRTDRWGGGGRGSKSWRHFPAIAYHGITLNILTNFDYPFLSYSLYYSLTPTPTLIICFRYPWPNSSPSVYIRLPFPSPRTTGQLDKLNLGRAIEIELSRIGVAIWPIAPSVPGQLLLSVAPHSILMPPAYITFRIHNFVQNKPFKHSDSITHL